MEFKMERPGLVKPGDKIQITEYQSYMNYSYIIEPAVAMSGCYPNSQIVDVTEGVVAAYFYYTIEPAVAMSANYRSWQRLKSGQGKVIDVKQTPQGYYVVCEFDEEDVE